MGVLNVGVLGAGVVGLNTAMEMQREFPTARYTIVADKFHLDTTSEVAAGLFRPNNSFSGPTPQIANQWLRDSYSYYSDLLQSADKDIAGMTETTGFYFTSTSEKKVRSPFLEGLVPIYRSATREELSRYPGNFKYGSYFSTLVTECTKFLPWAMNKFEQSGGRVVKRNLASFDDVADDFDVVFNCLGLGAKYLCDDPILVPIRGQILRVAAPWQKHFVFAEGDTYIIPRSDSVYLGGCRNYDSYDLTANKYDRASILERCCTLVPRLAHAPVVQEMVGLRPHRTPVRVEREMVNTGSKNLKVIHNYGHGGSGVTSAPGTAKYAVKLFKEQHSAGRGSSKL